MLIIAPKLVYFH